MKNNKVFFIQERNESMFQSSIQALFDELSDIYNLEVQYQHIAHKEISGNVTFYTALIIARKK